MSVSYKIPAAFALMALTGCGAVTGQDAQATLNAEVAAWSGETTMIAASGQDAETQVAATALYAETYVRQLNGVNSQLLATLQGAQPVAPPAPVVQAAPAAPVQTPDAGASLLDFAPPQSAASINPSDDCAGGLQTVFTGDSEMIYVTGRAFNVTGGTRLSAQWFLEGQQIFTSTEFSVQNDDDDYCFWFSITPADVAFANGAWTVRLFANGAPLPQEAAFTIEGGTSEP